MVVIVVVVNYEIDDIHRLDDNVKGLARIADKV